MELNVAIHVKSMTEEGGYQEHCLGRVREVCSESVYRRGDGRASMQFWAIVIPFL